MAENMPIDDTATVFCKNCKRDIPEPNFQMHDLHCYRNVRLCKKCQEPIPISEMDAHNDEYHAIVDCDCKMKIEKAELEEHQKKFCRERTVHCQYCEIDMKHIELKDHENTCGSRTEKCQDCGEFVMLKNAIQHVCDVVPYGKPNNFKDRNYYMDHSSASSNKGNNCNGFGVDMFGGIRTPKREENSIPDDVSRYLGGSTSRQFDRLQNHGIASNDSSKSNVNHDDYVTNNFQDLGINDQVRARGSLNARVKKQPAVRARKQQLTVSDGESSIDERHKPTRKNAALERRLRNEAKHPKIINSDSKTSNVNTGSSGYSASASFSTFDEKFHKKIERKREESEKGDTSQNVQIGEEPSTAFPQSNQNFELPCEICERLFPSDQFEAHQESCLDAQRDAFKQFDVKPSEPEEVIVVDDDQVGEITFIPCEFCGEKFPADNVILHQPYCDMNQQKHWRPEVDQMDESMSRRLDEFSSEYQTMQRDLFNDDALFNSPISEMIRNQFSSEIVRDRTTDMNGQRSLHNNDWDVVSDDEESIPTSKVQNFKDK